MATTPDWFDHARRLRADGRRTYRHVADELGVTEGAVYYWLNRDRCLRASLAYQVRHGHVRVSRRLTVLQRPSGAAATTPGMDQDSGRLALRLPPNLLEALRSAAQRNGRSVSAEAREAIKTHIHATFTEPGRAA